MSKWGGHLVDLKVLNYIADFFASFMGPFERSSGDKRSAPPTMSECFKSMATLNFGVASKMADKLNDVALLEGRSYWPGYAPSAASDVITLKWNSSCSRFAPQGKPEISSDDGCSENFKLDCLRANYSVSKSYESDTLIRADQPSTEERISCLKNGFDSDHDFARISEIAHQGHLAELAIEVMNHGGDKYFFQQRQGSVGHEIIRNGSKVVTVRSTVCYEAFIPGTSEVVSGVSLYAVVNTRIGFSQGKLDHQALGEEKTLMAFELRYETFKGHEISPLELHRSRGGEAMIKG